MLLGGRTPGGTFSSQVLDYNQETGAWTPRPNLPTWIAATNPVTVGLNVYLMAWKRLVMWNGTSEEFIRPPFLDASVGTSYSSAVFPLVL